MKIEDFLVTQELMVRDAMLQINSTSHRTLFVVDSNRLLKGSVTEGDILRFLMNGGVLSATVSQVMNTNPVRSFSHLDVQNFLETSKKYGLILLPIVNELNQVTDIQSLWELL